MGDKSSVYELIKCAASEQDAALSMLKAHPELLSAKTSIGETALHYLVIENHLDGVKFLIEQGADINSRNDSEDTPLMDAARLNYVGMCRFLIQHGANVNVKNIEGETALHRAAAAEALVIIDLLLEAGADVHAKDSLDESMLDATPPDKRTEVISILAKHGYINESA